MTVRASAFWPLLPIVLAFAGLADCVSAQSPTITYLANEGFLIESDGTRVLVDALFGEGLEHYAAVPAPERAALEALPGVGRKTANVILNTAFGEPTIAVDTHIFRVANRTGIAPGKTVVEVERKLLKFVADEFKKDAHHWLILHGRYTCLARKPKCDACIIADLCEYKHKTTT